MRLIDGSNILSIFCILKLSTTNDSIKVDEYMLMYPTMFSVFLLSVHHTLFESVKYA